MKGTRHVTVSNKMSGTGNVGGLMIVLDYPNRMAWSMRRHLQSGEQQLLLSCLQAVDLYKEMIWYTFAVPYQIEKKAAAIDIEAGRFHIREEINRVRPKKILTMGALAHTVVVGTASSATPIRRIRGIGYTVRGDDDRIIYGVTTYPMYQVLSSPELFRDTAFDFYKLATRSRSEPQPRIRQAVFDDPVKIRAVLTQFAQQPAVSCDTETSGLHPWSDEIEAIGFGIWIKDETADAKTLIIPYTALNDERVQETARDFFLGRLGPAKIVFHNAKFDIQFLSQWLGTDLSAMNVADTMLLNYLLDERPINDSSAPHGLKTISRVRYDAPDYKFDFKAFWSKPKEERDWRALHAYLSLDLCYTARLYHDLELEFEELRAETPAIERVHNEIMVPGVKVLSRIELKGVRIDVPYLRELGNQLRMEMGQLASEISVAAMELGAPVSFVKDLNPGSPKQIGELLGNHLGLPLPRSWKTGGQTTGKDALAELAFNLRQNSKVTRAYEKADLLDLILDYRGTSKLIGTYVDGLLERVDKAGYLHGEFNLAGTSTGRLSSQNPNLQNVPQVKGPAIRRAFLPAEGRVWLKNDYSQLEYRVAAYLCQDERMIQAFKDGRDIHVEVASRILGIDPHEVSKLQRYAAKFVGFGMLYGRGAVSIALGKELRGQNWTIGDAQRFIDSFMEQFPGLHTWMQNQRGAVRAYQQLETPLGRKRRWPFLTEESVKEAQRQALNFPIQSLASDTTFLSVLKTYAALPPSDGRVLLTVHDEIDFEIEEDKLDLWVPRLLEIMTTDFPVDFNLPIEAEAEYGPNWGELSKWEDRIQEMTA